MTVHRLDQDTSGLLVLALDPDTHRAASMLFQDRQVEKEYIALVQGWRPELAEHATGTIRMPIAIDWPNRPRKRVDPVDGKDSETRYTVLAREHFTLPDATTIEATRLLLEPVTGRGHQLRVHCAFDPTVGGLGTPILDDTLYNQDTRAQRLMLHATALAFAHPSTNEPLRILCPPAF